MPVGHVVAQSVTGYGVVAEPATSEVLHAKGHAVGSVLQCVLKVRSGPLVDDEHRLALALLMLLLVGELMLLYLDVVLPG